MRRRSGRKPVLSLSLFPFLAVLVCTMGALIILLILVVEKARIDVDVSTQVATAEAEPEIDVAALHDEKANHDWRRQVLETRRQELQRLAGDNRLKLSHLEDHIRRLEGRWRELSAQARGLVNLEESKHQDVTAMTQDLVRTRDEIEVARRSLQDAQAKAAQRKQAFAIIPYEGPNGTKRRPIYVECTDERVVLQPEGIVLRASDFEGSQGPGNPLDAALRTTREYLARLGDNRIHGEPYPLLIVRPNGTVAYAVARGAIKSWDDEFGYELVDAETPLAYPQPDLALRRELERSIADARSRQTVLAAAMPGRFGRTTNSPTSSHVVIPRGSGRPGDEPGFGIAGDASAMPGESNASFSRVFRQTGSGPISRQRSPGEQPVGWSGGNTNASRHPGSNAHSDAAQSAPNGRTGPGGTGPGGSNGPAGNGSYGAGGNGGNDGTGSGSYGAAGQGSYGASNNGTYAGNHPGGGGGGSGSGSGGAGGGGSRGAPGGSMGGPGGGKFSMGSPGNSPFGGGSNGGQPAGMEGSQNFGGDGATQTFDNSRPSMRDAQDSQHASKSPSSNQKSPGSSRPKSLAASRGDNWGLPQSLPAATGFTRYISVRCLPDRLIILPEAGDHRPATVIKTTEQLGSAVDPFVSAIWKRMDAWGIAAENGYWKPVLRVEVAPGAEGRYDELSALLDRSGLVMERK